MLIPSSKPEAHGEHKRIIVHHLSSNLFWATQRPQSLVRHWHWWPPPACLRLLGSVLSKTRALLLCETACDRCFQCRSGCSASSRWGWCGGICPLPPCCCLPKALLKRFASPRSVQDRRSGPVHPCKMLNHAFLLVGGKLITDWIGRGEPEMAEIACSTAVKKVSSPFRLCPPSTVLAGELELLQRGGFPFVGGAVL